MKTREERLVDRGRCAIPLQEIRVAQIDAIIRESGVDGFVPDPVLVSRYITRGSERNLVVIKKDLARFVHRKQLTTELRLYGLSFPEGTFENVKEFRQIG